MAGECYTDFWIIEFSRCSPAELLYRFFLHKKHIKCGLTHCYRYNKKVGRTTKVSPNLNYNGNPCFAKQT